MRNQCQGQQIENLQAAVRLLSGPSSRGFYYSDLGEFFALFRFRISQSSVPHQADEGQVVQLPSLHLRLHQARAAQGQCSSSTTPSPQRASTPVRQSKGGKAPLKTRPCTLLTAARLARDKVLANFRISTEGHGKQLQFRVRWHGANHLRSAPPLTPSTTPVTKWDDERDPSVAANENTATSPPLSPTFYLTPIQRSSLMSQQP